MEKNSNERRAHPRIPVRLPVEYKSLEDFFVDYALDISHGGMFVSTEKVMDIGTPVSVKFKMPDVKDAFEATGTVVRATGRPEKGVGIKFDPLSEKALAIIAKLWEGKLKE